MAASGGMAAVLVRADELRDAMTFGHKNRTGPSTREWRGCIIVVLCSLAAACTSTGQHIRRTADTRHPLSSPAPGPSLPPRLPSTTSTTATPAHPVSHPVAFVDTTGTGPASFTIFRYDPATGSLGPLGPTVRYGTFPAYSPDGKTLVFTSLTPAGPTCDTDVQAYDLYLLSADDTALRKLTSVEPCAEAGDAAWSPDGTRIVYTDNGVLHVVTVSDGRDLALPKPPGWSVDGELAGFTDFFHDPHSGDWHPSWSPDGTKIVFAQDPGYQGTGGIFVMDVASGASHRIADSGWSPAWSPDGATIAYSRSDRAGADQAVYLMAPDGSNLRRVSPPPVRDPGSCNTETIVYSDLHWSPDGTRMSVVTNGYMYDGAAGHRAGLFIVNAHWSDPQYVMGQQVQFDSHCGLVFTGNLPLDASW